MIVSLIPLNGSISMNCGGGGGAGSGVVSTLVGSSGAGGKSGAGSLPTSSTGSIGIGFDSGFEGKLISRSTGLPVLRFIGVGKT